ncbi:uncharacterized protein BDZ99DRAFT_517096 [Mytilinidion resinicola]|uniref:SprT-like domain-containing protein n=1 Tax=Mytilinidion resinicola TaxID=574789 RepID=A0A6A6YVI8_9PEZI|nr:uncharacterized protein BDZ99DRAFT_517096 [Mytilinidion resinicola]KAF2812780.1 hypothetical protein BDZ99DRAFT_517096 [Mytilinidion resinicola]
MPRKEWVADDFREELNRKVKSLNRVCTCPACKPEAYDLDTPCLFSPKCREIHSETSPASKAPVPFLSVRSYDAMHLADQTMQYIDRKGLQAYKRQRDAIPRWEALVKDGDLVARLARRNLKDSVPIKELQKALAVFNDLYFFGALKNIRIVYGNRLSKSNRLQGFDHALTEDTGQASTILISSTRHWGKEGWEVLATLLHEALHCFLDQLTSKPCGYCAPCKQRVDNIGVHGHGRAWQLVAMKLEEVAPDQLGFDLDMYRTKGLYNDLVTHQEGEWPSIHDLTVWGLDEG